jgi:DNA-binding transcriptional ArsR family regulator
LRPRTCRAARQNGLVIPQPTRPQLDVAARTFALLSAPVRLHLVALAAQGEYDVGTLSARAGVGMATASQHLTKLRLAGIISARRDGRRQIYTVEDPHVITMVQQIFEHIAPDGTLAPDPPEPLAASKVTRAEPVEA